MNIFKVVQKLSSFLLESHIFLEAHPVFETIPSMMAHQVCSIGHSPFARQPCSSRSWSSCWEREQLEAVGFQLLITLSACQFPHPSLQTAALIGLLTLLFCTFKGALRCFCPAFPPQTWGWGDNFLSVSRDAGGPRQYCLLTFIISIFLFLGR